MSRGESPRSPLGVDVALGLGAAALWTLLVPTGGVASPLPARLGFAVLLFTPFVVVVRRARDASPALVAAMTGALLTSLPLAVLAALLIQKTHHRALGAVTFAVLALGVWAFAFLVASRVSRLQAGRRFGQVMVRTGAAASAASAVAVLVLRPGALAGGTGAGAVSAVLLGVLALAAPRWTARRWVAALGVILWVALVSRALLAKTMHRAVDETQIGF